MQALIKDLDSTKFKNNILYDRVYPLSKLNEFNQNQKVDNSNVTHFTQAAHELYLATNKNSRLFSADDIKQITYSSRSQKKVAIGIINCDYTTLKKNAFDSINPLLSITGTGDKQRYKVIPNKNPFEDKQTLIIAALQENIVQGAEPIIFSIKESFFEYTTNPIENLFVKFDDGETKQIYFKNSKLKREITHVFKSSGTKTIEYYGTYKNGLPFKTASTVSIAISQQARVFSPPIKCESIITTFEVNEMFTPYEPEPLYIQQNATNINIDQRAKIEYKIFYSGTECVLRKPILITDGIDYGETRDIPVIYNDVLRQKDNTNINIGDKLRDLGYDVIIANFPVYKIATYKGFLNSHEPEILDKAIYRDGGADYIQRNAKGIKQLIKILNSSLVTNNSTEKLVVVGPSMGGLVSRWALKELEDEGYDHNTKLWVSFDSPHQGANIPLAMQYVAEFTENFDQLDKLNRIASKQILVHHYTNGSTATGGAPNFRDRFNTELSAMCYPINNIKKIALVNGSSNGILNYSAGHGLANIHVWMTSFPYGNAAFGDLIFSNDSGINKVFEIRTRAGIASWTTTTKYVSSIINIGSYDSAPGCKFSLTGSTALAGYINPPSQSGVNLYGNVTQQVDYFTFMPTKSTLDFKGNSFLLREPLNNPNLVQTHETPFDDYYTPPLQEEHVELNSANVAWLLNQLNTVSNTNIAQNIICGSRVSALTINGNENLCDATQKTYTLEPANLSNVNWTVTNLEILYSNNQEIRVRKINTLQASSITASYTGGGSTVQHTKLLTCIRPDLRFGIDYNFTNNVIIMLTDLINEFALSQQNIENIAWSITSGDGQISTSYNSLTADVYGSMFAGVVTVTTVEGDSYSQNFSWPDQNNCTAIIKIGRDQYQVVDICNNNALVNNISVKEIYNVYGNKLQNLPVTDPNINLRQGNKGDIQILRVVAGGKNLTTRIIKD